MFTDPLEHLSAELHRLDLLLHREILCLRATYALSLDEFRGLYVSDEQVDHYIDQALGHTQETPAVQELTERAEALRWANAERVPADLPWHRLVTAFDLSAVEQDILLLALAPEIDLKYESLYAYLNNDVTRKWPTCDLALRLFAPSRSQRMSLRRYLLPQAPLFRHSLLQPIQPTPERPSWLAGGFCITASLPHFLLGHSCQSPTLTPFVEYRLPATGWETVPVSCRQRTELQRLISLYQQTRAHRPPPVLIFVGRDGAGSGQAAEALCHALGIPLLSVDLQAVRASLDLLPKIAQELALQQRLLGAGVYLDHGEALFDKEGHPLPEASRILWPVTRGAGPLLLRLSPRHALARALQGPVLPGFPLCRPRLSPTPAAVGNASGAGQRHGCVPNPRGRGGPVHPDAGSDQRCRRQRTGPPYRVGGAHGSITIRNPGGCGTGAVGPEPGTARGQGHHATGLGGPGPPSLHAETRPGCRRRHSIPAYRVLPVGL